MAKIKVYLGDDQPSRADPDARFTGGPMQVLGSSTVHDVALDDHSPLKRRKVSFVESTPHSVDDNVEVPHSNQSLPNSEPPSEVPATLNAISAEGDNIEEPHSILPNSEPPPEVSDILDMNSADAEKAHETSDKSKKRKTGIMIRKKKKGKNEDLIPEDRSLGEKVQPDIAVVTRKGQEESQHHTPSIEQVDLPDVSTRPLKKGPLKEKKKDQVRMEVVIVREDSNASLSTTSNSAIVVQHAKSMFYKFSHPFGLSRCILEQDPIPLASTSALQTSTSSLALVLSYMC